jgi:two-component system, LuxR family, sensor kinase FixL
MKMTDRSFAIRSSGGVRASAIAPPDRLDAVLAASRDGLLVVAGNGSVERCNPAARALLDLPDSFGPGSSFIDDVNCFESWSGLAALAAGQKTGNDPVFFDIRRKDGTIIKAEATGLTDERSPHGAIMITLHAGPMMRRPGYGLSNHQASFVQMARQAGMSAIGTAMAHELNQPLTAMLLYLQTMQRMAMNQLSTLDEAYKDLIGKSVREGQRVAEIVKRVREIAARREPARRLVHLEAAIDDAIELSRAGRSDAVKLQRDYGTVGTVRIDEVEIQQVIVNLLSNAYDALADSPNGHVRIETRRAADHVRITVQDSGPGIQPRLVAKLFRPFESSKEHGLGIGLSISQAIAHAHGGDLLVDAGGKGQGAAFTLKLPLGEDLETDSDLQQAHAASSHRTMSRLEQPTRRSL